MAERYILAAMLINGGMVVFELSLGLLIQSMALMADAMHNMIDIAVMGISYGAERMARRPTTARMTFGYRKIEFLAALLNSIILSIAIAFILWHAVGRLLDPPFVPGRQMLLIASVALLGNGLAASILRKIKEKSINVKAAWLHSVFDFLFSAGVIVSALLIMGFEWFILDPLISIIICIFIFREVYRLIQRSVKSLLDAVPPGIDFYSVQRELKSIEGVCKVNDLHIWQSGSSQLLLSAHLTMAPDLNDSEGIIKSAHEMLRQKYGINHATIEILPYGAEKTVCCNGENI